MFKQEEKEESNDSWETVGKKPPRRPQKVYSYSLLKYLKSHSKIHCGCLNDFVGGQHDFTSTVSGLYMERERERENKTPPK